MRKLGISIYPEKSDKQEVLDYIKKMSEMGFSRIFSCLLSVTKAKEEIINEFKEINTFAKEHGYEVILDVSPRVFNDFGISYNDLSFFHELNADGIRLDLGFSGSEESIMTFNPYGLKVELNMSQNTHYLDTVMDYQPNQYKLIGCHNFYPHNYSGLSLEHFNKCTERFKKYGLNTSAFVTSQNQDTFGPWPVTEGLPTLESHRNLPVDIQMKHYIAMGQIDNIIISNCYPSPDELEKISKVNLNLVNLSVCLEPDITETEKKIILEELHFNRGDISGNLIRSTQPRVKYKGETFQVHNAPEILKRGDIIIESSEYGHYAGELQIVVNEMKNSGKSNVAGHICKQEVFLIDCIKPWQKFVFTEDEAK
ncbi:DUF871 domain-containing protein [Lacrimispora brassicae]